LKLEVKNEFVKSIFVHVENKKQIKRHK